MPFSLFTLTKPPFKFTFREKGLLVLVKTTLSSLFWNKLLIPHANCNGHVPFDMFHHIRPQMILWDFLRENIWVSSIGRCITLGYRLYIIITNSIVHLQSRIRVFTVVQRMDSQGLKDSSCEQQRLWSDYTDVKDDLSLPWPHILSCTRKCYAPTQTILQ